MREELRDTEVNEVHGGAVILSEPLGVCGFNKIGEVYRIKGVFKEMRNRLLDLYDDNSNMPAEDFDRLVRDDFKSRGWI